MLFIGTAEASLGMLAWGRYMYWYTDSDTGWYLVLCCLPDLRKNLVHAAPTIKQLPKASACAVSLKFTAHQWLKPPTNMKC